MDRDYRFDTRAVAHVTTLRPDASGDAFVDIPVDLLEELGWQEGDDIEIEIDGDHQLVLTKVGD